MHFPNLSDYRFKLTFLHAAEAQLGGTKGSRLSAKEFLPLWIAPVISPLPCASGGNKTHRYCKHIPEPTQVTRRSTFNRQVN